MATEPKRRTDEDIKRELASEREQLASALGDLQAAVKGKRRVAIAGAGALATAVAARAALKITRRLRGD